MPVLWQTVAIANRAAENPGRELIIQLARDGSKDVTAAAISVYGRGPKRDLSHFGNYSNSPTAQFSLHVNIREISCE
jgi:hypothetical protein